MITSDGPQARVQRFVAAYKQRLAQKAEELTRIPERSTSFCIFGSSTMTQIVGRVGPLYLLKCRKVILLIELHRLGHCADSERIGSQFIEGSRASFS